MCHYNRPLDGSWCLFCVDLRLDMYFFLRPVDGGSSYDHPEIARSSEGRLYQASDMF